MAVSNTSLLAAVSLFLCICLSLNGRCAAESHIVGDDRGWEPSSDVASWAARRIFLPGDTLWFAYSAAQEKIVELGSRDEYEACDLSNPITMYTDGLTRVSLAGEGTRYFASGDAESCKKGLKLPVEVKPRSAALMNPIATSEESAVAAAPTSGSTAVVGGARATLGGATIGLLMFLWF